MTLRIESLKKAFGEKQIFSDFSYSFTDKGLYVIKGDSGIGKTTLLRIISGIDKKFTGYVFGGGYENVSVSFQEYRLFPQLTALENITESVWEKANENNLSDAREMLFKLGFSQEETALFPHELSGGMKQRVSLARAFLKDSPILILDEPTKELDRDLCDIVIDMIKSETERRLVIMVTHSESDISNLNPTIINLNQK